MKILNRWYSRFEELSSGTLTVAGLAVILYGVFMRYVMNAPQAWVDEISKYLVIWGILMGGSLALRNGHHITVDLFYIKLPGSVQKLVNIFANTVGLLFCAFYFSYGLQLVLMRKETMQLSLDVGIPLWIVYMILPISAVMLTIRFAERLVKSIKAEPIKDRGELDDSNIV